jgi:hypothetical protein
VLGVPGKLGKNPVHWCQGKKIKNKNPLPRSCPNSERPNFVIFVVVGETISPKNQHI